MYWRLFSFSDRMTKHAAVLRPSWPVFECSYRTRRFPGRGVPLGGNLELSRLAGRLLVAVTAEICKLYLQPCRSCLCKQRLCDDGSGLRRYLSRLDEFTHGFCAVEREETLGRGLEPAKSVVAQQEIFLIGWSEFALVSRSGFGTMFV